MDQSASTIVSDPQSGKVQRRREKRKRPRRQPRFNVVLWNDDDHTYGYVIRMLQELFGYPREQGLQLATEVDHTGRVILLTTTREHAELKRDQIHSYGKDPSVRRCEGSMWSTIEALPESA